MPMYRRNQPGELPKLVISSILLLIFIQFILRPALNLPTEYITTCKRLHKETQITKCKDNFFGQSQDRHVEKILKDYGAKDPRKFGCIKMFATYKYQDTRIRSQVFSSTKEAERTDHECSINACGDRDRLNRFLKKSADYDSFKCYVYVSPQGSHLVYIWRRSVTLMNSIPFPILVILLFCTFCGLLWWFSVSYKRLFDPAKNIPEVLKKGNLREVQQAITRYNVNSGVEMTPGEEILPFYWAISHSYVEVANYLKHIGANLDILAVPGDDTIFHIVCESQTEDMITWCIISNLHKPENRLNAQRETPFHKYIQRPYNSSTLRVVKVLILAGADVTIPFRNGYSALDYVCLQPEGPYKWDIIHEIVTAGGPEIKINTILQQRSCLWELICLLIEAGYQFEEWEVEKLQDYLPKDKADILQAEIDNIPPLERLCRTKIRTSVGRSHIQEKVELLLPTKLRRSHLLRFLQIQL